jgi:UDP-N-acetylglucosamine transferase subunit ALG13
MMSQVISDVVITPARAGSILEALWGLHCNLPVLLISRALMNDHHTEIAFTLHEQREVLLAVDCGDLIPRLSEARLDRFSGTPFPTPRALFV